MPGGFEIAPTTRGRGMILTDEDVKKILAFARSFGNMTHTYNRPDDPNQMRIHQIFLELERRGLVERSRTYIPNPQDEGNHYVWEVKGE
jgi:Holliday junction resolvase